MELSARRDRNVTVSSTDNSSETVERRANAFAAAFLMPSDGIHDALRHLDKGLPSRQEHSVFDAASGGHIESEIRSPAGSQRIAYKDIAILAHHFGVSYQAALYRLKSLRHISHPESRKLLEQEGFGREYLKALDMFKDVGEREQRRYWDRELRGEIAHLAIEAWRREEISRGRVLELSRTLGIDGDTLLRLAEAVRGEGRRMQSIKRASNGKTLREISGKKVCPECGHVFQGNGWDGIDAHWRSKHEHIMAYEKAWPLLSSGSYGQDVSS